MVNKTYLKTNKIPYLQNLFRCKIPKDLVKVFSQKGMGGNVYMKGITIDDLLNECVEKINWDVEWEKLKVKW